MHVAGRRPVHQARPPGRRGTQAGSWSSAALGLVPLQAGELSVARRRPAGAAAAPPRPPRRRTHPLLLPLDGRRHGHKPLEQHAARLRQRGRLAARHQRQVLLLVPRPRGVQCLQYGRHGQHGRYNFRAPQLRGALPAAAGSPSSLQQAGAAASAAWERVHSCTASVRARLACVSRMTCRCQFRRSSRPAGVSSISLQQPVGSPRRMASQKVVQWAGKARKP